MIEFEVDMEYCVDDLDGVVLVDENGELSEMVFVPERTCMMIDNGSELCCSICDERHDYDDEPNYCKRCGAKVVER